MKKKYKARLAELKEILKAACYNHQSVIPVVETVVELAYTEGLLEGREGN